MNRATLARRFAEVSGHAVWKTFVIEVHARTDIETLLVEAFGGNRVTRTEDIHLHHLVGDVEFFVDHLDKRFVRFHTTSPTRQAVPELRGVIARRRDLDWMWLPSHHLRFIWPDTTPELVSIGFSARRFMPSAGDVDDFRLRVYGQAAERVLHLIEAQYGSVVTHSQVGIRAVDQHFGTVQEVVGYDGRFVASGDNFGFHQTIVQQVVGRYRRFVEDVEDRALRWHQLAEGGAQLSGAPVVLKFSRQIPDMQLFLDELFSARAPFRLWGVPRYDGGSMAEVEAIDLHVGEKLRFDVTPEWLRVYLFEGGCGNTVARLASNLQRHFDGALSMMDGELENSFKPQAFCKDDLDVS